MLAPFIYLGLISHMAVGYAIFGQFPDHWTLAGASIVIASGVYLVHRERVVLAEKREAAARASTAAGG